MKIKHWLLGLVIGLSTGLLIGAFYAFYDWQLNSGGIFRDHQGTNWGIVWDTVVSWWLPVTPWATVLSWLALFLFNRYKK